MVYAIEINSDTFPAAKFGDFASILNLIVPNLILGAGIIFFIMLLIGGFMYMQSSGNPENIKKAQALLRSSIIGLIIVFISFLLVKLISSMLNVGSSIPL